MTHGTGMPYHKEVSDMSLNFLIGIKSKIKSLKELVEFLGWGWG